MNPSNNFIKSHRRLLGVDLSSNAYHENHYKTLGISIATFIIVDLIIITFIFIFKCFIKTHPSPDPNHTNHDHPTTSETSNNDALNAIPVYTCGTPALSATSSSCSFEVESCVICLDDYVHGDCVRVLPKCKHMFHKDCIDQWLSVRSLHCPICRERTIEQDVEPARTNCRNSVAANPSSLVRFSLNMHMAATL